MAEMDVPRRMSGKTGPRFRSAENLHHSNNAVTIKILTNNFVPTPGGAGMIGMAGIIGIVEMVKGGGCLA